MGPAQSIYQSEDYWVLNKNPGLHSDEVLAQCENPAPVASKWELVNRLDFETSGALLFCRQELLEATRTLLQKERSVRKIYVAGASREIAIDHLDHEIAGVVAGRYRSSKKVRFIFADDEASKRKVRSWHSSRPALMKVSRLAPDPTDGLFSGKLYEVELITGARHQIRAFFEACGATLIGDPIYREDALSPAPVTTTRLELHAWKLSFQHPMKNETIEAIAPFHS